MHKVENFKIFDAHRGMPNKDIPILLSVEEPELNHDAVPILAALP
jgi:hypothetical protein